MTRQFRKTYKNEYKEHLNTLSTEKLIQLLEDSLLKQMQIRLTHAPPGEGKLRRGHRKVAVGETTLISDIIAKRRPGSEQRIIYYEALRRAGERFTAMVEQFKNAQEKILIEANSTNIEEAT